MKSNQNIYKKVIPGLGYSTEYIVSNHPITSSLFVLLCLLYIFTSSILLLFGLTVLAFPILVIVLLSKTEIEKKTVSNTQQKVKQFKQQRQREILRNNIKTNHKQKNKKNLL